MTHFRIAHLVTLFLSLFTISPFFGQTTSETRRPNIIFILTDDQRFDALGYAGNKLISTPEMDRLAKEGTYFSNAMVTTPICAASRASILTGLYERTHSYNFQTGNIRPSYMAQSYPRILKENGYKTGFFGKYGVRYDSLNKQFHEYESYDRNGSFKDKRGYFYKTIGNDTIHLTRYTGQQALDFIEKTSKEEPFCLSLSFSAPHAHDAAEDQYFWQQESNNLLADTTIPPPVLGEEKYFLQQPEFVREGFNRTRWHWRYDTPEKYQHSVKGYYRMISGIDRELGKIRNLLEKKGLAQNTVIILMGDNGYFLGERQLAGKWLLYDNSVRVPLIVFDPRQRKQKDSEALALNVDVPSTILDLAGLSSPAEWQGKSLMPLIKGEDKNLGRDTVLIEHLWEFEHIPPSEGVRTKDWKYFRYVNDQSEEELYFLKNDPEEIQNLAANSKYESILVAFRNKTNELIKKYSDAYSQGPTELTVEMIRQPEGLKVLDLQPEYSWEVPKTAVNQLAYQILVASSQENVDKNLGDIWNSGQVRSSESTNIEQAEKLQAGKTYYWKVRIWDEDNRLTAYSQPQEFTTSDKIEKNITTGNRFQVDTITPKAFEKRENFFFIDFGKDAFATLKFNYRATKAHTLTFRIGEQLKNSHINREPEKRSHIRYQEIKVPVTPNQTEYLLPIRKDKRNTLPGKALPLPEGFPVLMPFRYAEIEGAENPISSQDFVQLAYHSYWEDDTSGFESDNDILNQVWNLCKYSIKATTFNGLYVDGDRERIPYEADAYLNQLSHYTTDREYAIARQTIEYFMENPTWPTEWQQHVALMFHADYMYTGNTELIKKYYDRLKHKTLYELAREDGLITSTRMTPELMKKLGFPDDLEETFRDIVDWPPANWGGDPNVTGERDGFDFKPYNTVVNSFYYQNMLIMAEFAKIMGRENEALDYELLALKAKKAINEKLFNKETGAYVDGEGSNHSSIHGNMMPLAFGIVPKEHEKSVIEFIKSRGMACSVYGAQYLMDGLYRAGASDYAFDLLTSTSDRSWYNMIRIGSTITLEAWDMKYKPNADWNHAWGAVPANIIPRRLWGIQPKEAGFKVAQIRPQLAGLNESTIEVPTILGSIKADYKKVNSRLKTYTISIPANMVADFVLEDMNEMVVTHNGQKVSTAFKSVRLTPGEHKIKLTANSF
ncbi:DUF4976 domain-containing protein [Euzebyella marina]|uniref:alpha-L-rhamnosidase n=1 Tax=Euzebyella marina TaxID=1761453 RepID=A0A3G2L566_9FLAO|nr:sulfatase-like hydrolase/transferase [Euzebyella marina]AYN67414.1 DUF4976 domain-containing protein [Euzebyella marina]